MRAESTLTRFLLFDKNFERLAKEKTLTGNNARRFQKQIQRIVNAASCTARLNCAIESRDFRGVVISMAFASTDQARNHVELAANPFDCSAGRKVVELLIRIPSDVTCTNTLT